MGHRMQSLRISVTHPRLRPSDGRLEVSGQGGDDGDMLRTDELEYDLPPGRVATEPVSPRDSARLIVLRRSRAWAVEHRIVRDLPGLLEPTDVLVLNRTRVVPARLLGVREETGGSVEALYLGQHEERPSESDRVDGSWRMLVKARRFREGAAVRVRDREGRESGLRLVLRHRDATDESVWIVTPEWEGREVAPSESIDVLSRVGLPPLPPYIRAARKQAHAPAESRDDEERYQTTYAREAGSVAAPTAGLHFTRELLDSIRLRGVEIVEVLLHVGAGTFKPVETEFVEQHAMHAEWCSMSAPAVASVRSARDAGRRVIAVGTTSVRVLETYALAWEAERGVPESVQTRLLITPGHRWRWADGLMTNFHLPRSTLMALVAAMLPGGVEELKAAYSEAIRAGYRFYSYGDAMLILP